MMQLKFAILGAGNGGHAMAADLSMAGYEVNLYELPKFKQNIKPIQDKGGIEVIAKDPYGAEIVTPTGGKTGFAQLSTVTVNIKEAVKNVDVIMVVVPAFGQMSFVENLIPYLEDDQIIVFNPGNFGALECLKTLNKKGVKKNVTIGETETLIYACRRTGPAQVWIKSVKEKTLFAALPAKKTDAALGVLKKAFPQFTAATNVLETSINNPNFVIHPASVLLNVVKIEHLGSYDYSHYDATPSVGKVMEAVDSEKMAIATALGLKKVSTAEIIRKYYGAKGRTLYEVICDAKPYKKQTAPGNMKFRYITEDVPYGLVPLASIARLLDVSAPTIEALISLASVINERNYWKEGRTVEKLGLSGLTAKEIIRIVSG